MVGQQGAAVGAPFILRIIEARGLKKSDLTGKSDPYCLIKFKKGLFQSIMHHEGKLMTRVVERNLNPIWNEEFVLHPHKPEYDIVQIQVYDKDRIGADTLLGKVDLPVAQYWKRGFIDEWIPLQPKKKMGKPAFGELHILINYNGDMGGQSWSSGMGQQGIGQQGLGQQGLGYGSSMGSGYGSSMGSSMGSGYGSGYGSGLGSSYGSGYSSGYGTSSYGSREISQMGSGMTGTGLSGYPTTKSHSDYVGGTLPHGSSSGSSGYGYAPVGSSSNWGSSGYHPSSIGSSGYGSSGLGSSYGSSGFGSSGWGSSGFGSGMGSFVNYPPPVARHQDKW